MPSFYIYLIAVTRDSNGDRRIVIGVAHWLLGIYAELEIHHRIYPESFNGDLSTAIYLPYVTFNSRGFYMDYVEHIGLSQAEAADFVRGVVDTLIDYIGEHYRDDRYAELAEDFEDNHGIAVSVRLVQILIYHRFLVRTVQDWTISKCECTLEDQICYCGSFTKDEIIKCKKLYFRDAKLLVSDEVYFTTT
ncbi:Hypothetical predicted protein [Paramuricea clavata]|uniref:Uncharacterized protein n=1 Tax=Paramuricea clavata TaxID=317549 RepID=A0A6S7J8B5_PARCT|nr:Hypothetical predicted protein [Paramuricea clavata]